MQLDNQSPWSAALIPGWGLDRNMQMTCVVKTGFKWHSDGSLQPLTADECEVVFSDEYQDDNPETGPVLQSSDTVPFKKGFEWLLTGTAKPAPNVTHHPLTVSFQEGSVVTEKAIYAIGPRHWKKSLFGVIPSQPETLTEELISYKHAFGGSCEGSNGKTIQFAQNPIGTGYYKTKSKDSIVKLPKFESKPFIQSPKDKPMPAGFGALSLTWSPRSKLMQSLNAKAAEDGQCPYPQVVPESLYNSAPIDQQMKSPPRDGCILTLKGFSNQPINLKLPSLSEHIRILHVQGEAIKKVKPECDTLIVNTDEQTIAYIWRASIPWHPLKSPLSQLLVAQTEQEGTIQA
ncbi:DUF2169 domain-containing protein [Reinekea forsetii]|nr:DUF2169 domain-containing protein [Reinekea forsetii]